MSGLWRHKKRGSIYRIIGRGHMQINVPEVDMVEVVIYQSVTDESIWVRPVSEFEDGRFESLSGHEES
jgi:hypothetical protein